MTGDLTLALVWLFASKRRMHELLMIAALGLIEGITEFLPISSTGHLLIAEHFWGKQSDLFNAVIQCGAVLAVVLIYQARIRSLVFGWREKASQEYLLKLGVAFFITGSVGLVLKKLGLKLPHDPKPVAVATLVGGVLFVVVERWLKGRPATDEVTWKVAAAIGAAQLLAPIFPGASRSGTTILMALALGLSRPAAAEFSFLLGIPTLLSVGGLEIFHAVRHPEAGSVNWGLLGLGTAVAAVTAFIAVKWLLRYVQQHTFTGFGYYRIVVGAVILAVIR